MTDASTDGGPLTAGTFSAWLVAMQSALRGDAASDVPCDGCTACCTASQFVHIGPNEIETIAHIPAELLFPAPRLPPGHVVMGYDERGHCPMLVENGCSIYDHRPRTCRTYDCRVFPAAGVEPDEEDGAKRGIARRARRWRFDFPTELDQVEHDAVRAAPRFVRERRDELGVDVTANATQIAVAAVRAHRLFLREGDGSDRPELVEPDPEEVRLALRPA